MIKWGPTEADWDPLAKAEAEYRWEHPGPIRKLGRWVAGLFTIRYWRGE